MERILILKSKFNKSIALLFSIACTLIVGCISFMSGNEKKTKTGRKSGWINFNENAWNKTVNYLLEKVRKFECPKKLEWFHKLHPLPVSKRHEMVLQCCGIEIARQYISTIQSWSKLYIRLLNKPYVNEVTLTGQNPPWRQCHPLEIFTQFVKGLDLLMLKILGL